MGAQFAAEASQKDAAETKITKIMVTRLSPIENDTSGSVSYAYPYSIRIYYKAPFPDNTLFAIDWGSSLTGLFPFDTLSSGRLRNGTYFQDFGTVFQESGDFKVSILALASPPGTAEDEFIISVPTKKMRTARKIVVPKRKVAARAPDPPQEF